MTNKRGGYLSLDTEYSIPSFEFKIPLTGKNKGRWKVTRKPEGLHGWKNPKCDVYTFIYAAKPDDVKVIHSKKGFNRKVPYRLGKALQQSHTIIGANLKADLGFIWHELAFQEWLLKGGEIWDVQYVSYLLSGQRWLYPSLADMQKYYLGQKTKVSRISYLFSKCIDCREIIKGRNKCKRIWKSYNYYAKEDGRTPMLIMQKQYAEAKAKGMLPLIKVYNRYLLALIMMEVNGIPLDMPAVEKLYKEYSLKMVEYLEQATEMVKEFWTDKRLPAYNVNSSQHSSALLFGGHIKSTEVQETGEVFKTGLQKGKPKTKKVYIEIPIKGFELNPIAFSKETKKQGVYEVNEGTIENIYKHSKNQNAHKYCKLLKLSKAYKQKISTYLNAMLNMSVDGIVRPNYNNCATATSRLSCSAPNAQNLPAHGDFGSELQSLLRAPEGWTCVNIDYCLAPGTKVLTEEFVWENIEDIKEGDKLIGFEENKTLHAGNKWEQSIVEKTKRLVKPCYKIITDETTIICSEDHMFLVGGYHGQPMLRWVAAKDMKKHYTFTKVMEVWDTPDNYEAGWAGGFLDGEGYISNYSQIGFGQNNDGHNKLCFDAMCSLFDKYMVNTENRFNTGRRCHIVRPAGLRTAWQAVGIFQPKRLKQKLKETYTNTTIRSKCNRKVKIQSIEFIGDHEVIALQTSTKTFLAEGFLSHNCQLETFCRALLTKDPTLISDLQNGKDFHVQNMCWGYGISYEEGYKLSKIDKDPVWSERRSGAKAVTFGEAYGQMPESMAARTGWETSIIEQIYKQMYENYPELITFEKKVNEEVEKSSIVATKEGLSKKSAKDHQDAKGVPTRFHHNVELLPIREQDKKTYTFDPYEYRHIGTYVSITGKRYTFKEYGSRKKDGEIFRYYKPTQQKNYGMQGLAGDCQAISTAEMFMFLLQNQDKVKLVNEVHDSKWFLIKNEHLACILPKLCGIMKETSQLLYREFNIPVIVNFEADSKIGPDFSDMIEYKEKL